MAVDLARVARDEEEKLRLEGPMARRWADVSRRASRAFARGAAAGAPPDVGELVRSSLEPGLAEHYAAVSAAFSGNARAARPDLELDEDEDRALEASLALALAARARGQATLIGNTSAEDASVALSAAEAQRAVEEAEGRRLDSRAFGVTAGALLLRRMAGRTSAVSVVETQAPAELAKAAEVRALLGLDPLAAAGGAGAGEPTKEWVSVGDSHVRPHHLAADGQVRPASELFEVGGEFLDHPGDTSHGAGPANIVNCRCSAQYDLDAVAARRASRR